jgi:uncharacterized protein
MSRLAGAAFLLVLLVACGSSSPCLVPPPKVVIRTPTGPATLNVEVASTLEAQQRGLSGRSSLGADDGMAFTFRAPVDDAFWMKGTTIPLSIAFWDGRGRIVALFDMAPCGSGPCRRYQPNRPYVGAVEANRGYFSAHGIGVGDRIRLVGSAACQ